MFQVLRNKMRSRSGNKIGKEKAVTEVSVMPVGDGFKESDFQAISWTLK